jgi:ABC-2 type transport system ATP-binding protein
MSRLANRWRRPERERAGVPAGEAPATAGDHARPGDRAGSLLTVSGLSRSYGKMAVLTGVDLEVGWGEAVAVTGPNGSGKTTLLRCVAGGTKPTAGTVQLCGRPLRESDPWVRRNVAAVLDDAEFFSDLPVVEHLALLMCAHGDGLPDEHAAELLDEAGLVGAAGQLPATLSSGQRRRLALLTCFARPRSLALLDEPEQRLDRPGRQWLTARLLSDKAAGRGVLFTSHDRGLVRAVADRVIDLAGVPS